MDYFSFLKKAKDYPIFRVADALKWFPLADKRVVLNQLHLWTLGGRLERLRKNLYILKDYEIKDPFVLTGLFYSPSYVSLESALNFYGMIPDIPFATTCVSTAKTKSFHSASYGTFAYHRIRPELFFGFQTVEVENTYAYNIARQEKALFDFFYLRATKTENPEGFLEEMRLSLPRGFKRRDIKEWSGLVSPRNKNFHALINVFLKTHAK